MRESRAISVGRRPDRTCVKLFVQVGCSLCDIFFTFVSCGGRDGGGLWEDKALIVRFSFLCVCGHYCKMKHQAYASESCAGMPSQGLKILNRETCG